MTDERLEYLRGVLQGRTASAAARELLAEVDRLRAAVERVKALPRYGYDKVGQVHRFDEEDHWLYRDHVLAALEDMKS